MSNDSGGGGSGVVGTLLFIGLMYWIAYAILVVFLVVLAAIALMVAAAGYAVYWAYEEFELPGLIVALTIVAAVTVPMGLEMYHNYEHHRHTHQYAGTVGQSVGSVTTETPTTESPFDTLARLEKLAGGDLLEIACQQLGVPPLPQEPFTPTGAIAGERAILGIVRQTNGRLYGPICAGVDPNNSLDIGGWDVVVSRMAEAVQSPAYPITVDQMTDSDGLTDVSISWDDPQYGQYDTGERLAYANGRFYLKNAMY